MDSQKSTLKSTLTIGTRGSPLALVQARLVASRLKAILPPAIALDIVSISTTGDRVQNQVLSEIGGKGLFTKEIEAALYDGTIDLAVHSMKDMATVPPQGLCVPCMLEREDPRDVLLASFPLKTLKDLPLGARVGTASLRRKSQLLFQRPDLHIVPLRGNVETRLKKMKNGDVDATVLALAGLKRLGFPLEGTLICSLERMLPAVAQGAIGIQCREGDHPLKSLLETLNHHETFLCVQGERSFLKTLEGSCRMPIGGYGFLEGERFVLRGFVGHPQGQKVLFHSWEGKPHQASQVGEALGNWMLKHLGKDFFMGEWGEGWHS